MAQTNYQSMFESQLLNYLWSEQNDDDTNFIIGFFHFATVSSCKNLQVTPWKWPLIFLTSYTTFYSFRHGSTASASYVIM